MANLTQSASLAMPAFAAVTRAKQSVAVLFRGGAPPGGQFSQAGSSWRQVMITRGSGQQAAMPPSLPEPPPSGAPPSAPSASGPRAGAASSAASIGAPPVPEPP